MYLCFFELPLFELFNRQKWENILFNFSNPINSYILLERNSKTILFASEQNRFLPIIKLDSDNEKVSIESNSFNA